MVGTVYAEGDGLAQARATAVNNVNIHEYYSLQKNQEAMEINKARKKERAEKKQQREEAKRKAEEKERKATERKKAQAEKDQRERERLRQGKRKGKVWRLRNAPLDPVRNVPCLIKPRTQPLTEVTRVSVVSVWGGMKTTFNGVLQKEWVHCKNTIHCKLWMHCGCLCIEGKSYVCYTCNIIFH